MPMKRYAAKFIKLPHAFANGYSNPQMFPNGAPIFVTKLIIAKMKHMVIMAISLPLFLVSVIIFV